MVSVLGKNVYINANTFKNNKTIVNIDLCDVPWVNNSMFNAFYNCNNLTSITNINQNVTNMSRTFQSCSNLVNVPVIPNSVTDMSSTFEECASLVNAPVIPNSVTDMYYTFFYCISLVNAPVIPNSVTDMYYTFCYCIRLVNAPVIPNSVTDMYGTFHSCSNLVNVPVIPNSVTHMVSTFNGCSNLTGNIFIQSENITNASGCFTGQPQKNVYIPFTYENGVNTKTYNAFIDAGYKTDGSVNGVYLKDANEIIKLYTWRDTEHDITIYTLSDSPSIGDRIFRNDGSSYGVSENIGSSLYVKNNNIVSTSPSENKVVFYASSSGVLTDTITCNCIRYAQGDIYTSTPLSISITSLDPNSKGSLTVDRYVNNVYDGGWYTSFTTDSSGNVNNAIYIPKDETLRYGFMIDETNNAYTGWNCISIGNNAYQGYIELQSDIWTGYFNDTLAGVSIPITNNITIHMMSSEEEKAIWGVDDTQYTITQSGSTIYLNTYIGTNTSVVVPRSKS